MTLSQRWAALSNRWEALFRDHEIFIRTNGDVRFITLSARLQRRAANIAVVVLGIWVLVTVAMLGWQARSAWLQRDVDARAVVVERAEARVASERGKVENVARDLSAKLDYIEAVNRVHFGDVHVANVPPTATAPAAGAAPDKISELGRIGVRERQIVAAMTRAVAARSARAETVLRSVGIRPGDAAAGGQGLGGMGGPFIPDDRIGVPEPRDAAIHQLTLALNRMETLEQLVVAIPSSKPAEVMRLSSGFGYRADSVHRRGRHARRARLHRRLGQPDPCRSGGHGQLRRATVGLWQCRRGRSWPRHINPLCASVGLCLEQSETASRRARRSPAWAPPAVRPARTSISRFASAASPSIPAVSWRCLPMFSKSRPTQTSESAPAPSASVPARMATGARHTTFSIIGADVIITGNVSASVDLHVDGRIEGDIACASLVQGQDSMIKGAVIAETAKLSGTVEGSIAARDLTIQSSARITGDVTYENLVIEQGSQVDGRFAHRRAGSPAQGRPMPDQSATQELLPPVKG